MGLIVPYGTLGSERVKVYFFTLKVYLVTLKVYLTTFKVYLVTVKVYFVTLKVYLVNFKVMHFFLFATPYKSMSRSTRRLSFKEFHLTKNFFWVQTS